MSGCTKQDREDLGHFEPTLPDSLWPRLQTTSVVSNHEDLDAIFHAKTPSFIMFIKFYLFIFCSKKIALSANQQDA